MKKKSIRSDLARIDRMRDAEIDYSDIPPLTEKELASACRPKPKQSIGVRLDRDVLA